MKGYKGMRYDMTCRGMKFEIGKTYHINGEINLCKNGLHFCERLIDVLNFYVIDNNNRYFEVEANGEIKTDGIKSVTSSLTIVREINDIELNRAIYSNSNSYTNDNGNGYGNGNDCSNGNGYGNGDSFINFYSYDHGYGDGIDYSDGYGSGNGHGHGDGFGCIQDILKYV